jgi:hypothetical protein
MPSEYRIHNEVEYHLSSYSVHLWNEIPSIIVNNCCVEQLGLLWPCTGPSARISRDFSPGGYLTFGYTTYPFFNRLGTRDVPKIKICGYNDT